MSKGNIEMNVESLVLAKEQADNLVKVVTLDEWYSLQSTINILVHQVNVLNNKLSSIKQEGTNHD